MDNVIISAIGLILLFGSFGWGLHKGIEYTDKWLLGVEISPLTKYHVFVSIIAIAISISLLAQVR
tara:strand:- start:673 stop:867 length:195 start_codon:yes stop_codon:yes gene_type:complete